MTDILIYGSYGYTGRLITQCATDRGLKPILAGRNEGKLKTQAEKYHLSYLVFDLSEAEKLKNALQKVELVIHVAGPYSHTAETMLNACLETKTHYVDITGEIEVFEWMASQNERIKKAGIVAISGAGFDVVPSDCLVSYLKSKMPDATHLQLAFKGVGELSRGTALTMIENIDRGGMIRQDGKLKSVRAGYKTKVIKLGSKEVQTVSIPWGDVSTAYHSTGIPNIIVYTAVDTPSLLFIKSTNVIGKLLSFSPIQNFLKKQIEERIKGPNEKTNQQAKSHLWGKVRNAKGESLEARLETPEAYWLTGQTAVASAKNILATNLKSGFYTPSSAFGADFIMEFEGVKRF
ncbi:MAG: short subunit dehydrogenase-like uncharacterized protein [Flammeovirgaceae bacterium]|jgi:short subunit dehydrogenase-like uncharacterized protein